MKPVYLEVFTPVLTAYSHCQHCEVIFDQVDVASKKHQMDMDEYPEEVKRDYARICEWAVELAQRHQGRVIVKITDPASLEGLWKSIRYRVRKYPTFLIDGEEKVVGWHKEALEGALNRRLAEAA